MYPFTLQAFDLGVPQQASEETYVLTVAPYNYHAPQFVFPAPGAVLRLARVSTSCFITTTSPPTH